MDPDANIAAQRDLITRLRTDPHDKDALSELAELNQALLDWLANGGFDPAAPDWINVAATGYVLVHDWPDPSPAAPSSPPGSPGSR